MLSYLSGCILAHTKDGAIIGTDTLGYEVIGAWLGRHSLGEAITVWTYQYFENQSIPRLVGCETLAGRELLIQLLGVNGVGPKMGSRIVDAGSADRLTSAITGGDLDFLTHIKGLGKKTAQKIILELGKTLVDAGTTANSYLYDALSELKFTRGEIDKAIAATDLTGLSESSALGAVLKTLGRAK